MQAETTSATPPAEPHVTEEQIRHAYEAILPRLVRRQLRQGVPPSVSDEDLHGAGVDAIMAAARTFAGEGSWEPYVATAIKRTLYGVVVKARREAAGLTTLNLVNADGEESPREDATVVPPDELAERREGAIPVAVVPLGTKGAAGKVRSKKTTRLQRIIADSPNAAELGRHVAALREAIYSAVKPEDMSAVMKNLVERAKRGDDQAVRLLMGYVLGSASGVVVQQVTLNHEEEFNSEED